MAAAKEQEQIGDFTIVRDGQFIEIKLRAAKGRKTMSWDREYDTLHGAICAFGRMKNDPSMIETICRSIEIERVRGYRKRPKDRKRLLQADEILASVLAEMELSESDRLDLIKDAVQVINDKGKFALLTWVRDTLGNLNRLYKDPHGDPMKWLEERISDLECEDA